MDKRILAILAIAILLLCNAVALCVLHTNKQEKQEILEALYPYAVKSACLEDMIKDNAHYGHGRLNDFAVFDLKRSELNMSDLFSSKDSLLFIVRISDRFCSSCVEYCINLLDSIEGIGDISVLYLLESTNFNVFEKSAKNLGILEKSIFRTDSYLENLIELAEEPYIMVLNCDLTIEHCFFPKKGNTKIDADIIRLIIEIYGNRLQKKCYPSCDILEFSPR